MRRNQKLVIVTLDGDFTQNQTPIIIPLKQEPGPHQHYKIVKSISMGE